MRVSICEFQRMFLARAQRSKGRKEEDEDRRLVYLLTKGFVAFYIRPMPEIEYFRGKDLLGIEMLSQVATNLIVRYSTAPSRGNVRLRVTPRIARHYLNEGLLGEPTGQMGTATVFNYGNLVRLLAVKKLLVENWSIVKIRELMQELDITALENFIRGDRARGRRTENRSGRAAASVKSPHRDESSYRTSDTPPSNRAVSLFGPTPTTRTAPQPVGRASDSDWIELTPGLELRVRRGFRLPQSATERAQIQDRFNAVVFSEPLDHDGEK